MAKVLTEEDVERLIRAQRDALTELRALLMAHIRQTTKLRPGNSSTRTIVHTASGILNAQRSTTQGIGTVTQNANSPPVWQGQWAPAQTPPTVLFTEGVAAVFPVGGLVADPEGDAVTITKNSVLFHSGSGVTYEEANKLIRYDGVGTAGGSSGHQFSADDGVSDTIVQFGLKSTSTGTAKPFCFPHEFKRGDVAQGRDIVANIPDFQASIVNRYSDGSAKIAILAGHADLTANTTRFLDLKPGTANAGTAITEAQLIAAGAGADSFQLGTLGTVLLSNVLGRVCTGKGVAGLIRTRISGPEMSEFHYYSPVGTDNHLALFFYIRFFKNGACEIEVKVENGWLKVPSPDVRTYAPTFTINGTNRTGSLGTLTHYNRTTWGMPFWRGTDPAVKPIRNVLYILSTGMRPNYGWTSPSEATLAAYSTSTITPFAQGNLPEVMGSAGDDQSIGLLQKHEALHCTSSDTRTFDAVVTNGNTRGSYSIHIRFVTTMRPVAFSSYPNLVIRDINGESGIVGTGSSSTNDYTPVLAGGANTAFKTSHLPSWGYIPFLETGRWSHLEETQFCVALNFLKTTNTTRQGTSGLLLTHGAIETRGSGWAMRTLAHALCITPDGDTYQTELASIFAANMAYNVTNYVGSTNQLGIPLHYSNYEPGSGHTSYALWQDHFVTASLGWARDLNLPVSPAVLANLDAWLGFKAKCPAFLVGGVGPNDYCFRRAAAHYTLIIAPNENTGSIATLNANVFTNPGDCYVANFGVNNDCTSGSTLLGSIDQQSPPAISTSYWGNFFIALSAAVDSGNVAARTGYPKVRNAPNFESNAHFFNDDPRYGVVPRSI